MKTVDTPTYQSALHGRPRRSQIGFAGWYTDYLSESGFLGILACQAPYNTSGFCDTDIDSRMQQPARRQITDPAAARRLWSGIEHDLVDLAPWVPLVDRNWVNLVSERRRPEDPNGATIHSIT